MPDKKPKADDKKPEQTNAAENEESTLQNYIDALKLEDIGSWTKESQAAYIKARLKARQNQTKEERAEQEKHDHWDLF